MIYWYGNERNRMEWHWMKWKKEWMNYWMNEWLNDKMIEWLNDRLNDWLDEWLDDLLDDLLSSIPTAQRTPVVLNKLHNMIERFKQLKNMFSEIDEEGIDKPIVRTAQYKPLVERLEKLNKKLPSLDLK